MIANLQETKEISLYQPSEAVVKVTEVAQKDFSTGTEILNKPYNELNGYSVIDRMNIDQRTFQSFVDESDDDPNEAWKWKGTRALARKKAFAMHAHMTSSYIVPGVVPQNDSQDEDRAMAAGMRDIVEWQTINSNYRPSFLLASMGMLVNPVVYLQGDYCEVYQTIKERTGEGYSTTQILDEVLSGLNCRVLSADQVLITNAYEQDIQKQRSVSKVRYVDYEELRGKYENHPNWGFLKPGIRTVFNPEDGLFYDVKDDEHPNLCQEVTWENRREDAQICYLNGIYFGDETNVDWNPIRHRDNRNAPKYDIVPFGYHRVNEHFFFFASLMFETGWDDKLIDAMYQVTMNREFLDLEPPTLVTGVDKIDTAVAFPGAVFATDNKDARATSLVPPRNGNSYAAMQAVEDSMSEATVSETQMGALPAASTKAYTVAKTEQNAKILLSGAMKALGESVTRFGELMIDIALQHLTTAQIDEISGETKYREFILHNQMVGGRKVSKKIRFDDQLLGRKMDEKQKKQYAMGLLEESGYPDNKQSILVLNPFLFSKGKYLYYVDPDEMLPKNKEFMRIMAERMYTLLRTDPLIDPEALVRNYIAASAPQQMDELIAKRSAGQQMNVASILGQGTNGAAGGGKPPVLPAMAGASVEGLTPSG